MDSFFHMFSLSQYIIKVYKTLDFFSSVLSKRLTKAQCCQLNFKENPTRRMY